jgi:hypothetical protein
MLRSIDSKMVIDIPKDRNAFILRVTGARRVFLDCLTQKKKALCFSETSVNICQLPEDAYPRTHYYFNTVKTKSRVYIATKLSFIISLLCFDKRCLQRDEVPSINK